MLDRNEGFGGLETEPSEAGSYVEPSDEAMSHDGCDDLCSCAGWKRWNVRAQHQHGRVSWWIAALTREDAERRVRMEADAATLVAGSLLRVIAVEGPY